MDKVVAFVRSQSLDDFIPVAPKRIAAERDRRTK
jgi:hypothetical protein